MPLLRNSCQSAVQHRRGVTLLPLLAVALPSVGSPSIGAQVALGDGGLALGSELAA